MNRRLNSLVAYLILVISFLVSGTVIIFNMSKSDGIAEPINLVHNDKLDRLQSVTADWLVYQDLDSGIEFKYPNDWQKNEGSNYFIKNDMPVLTVGLETWPVDRSVRDFAQQQKVPECQGQNLENKIIKASTRSALYILSCPSAPGIYRYATRLRNGQVLQIAYQDNVDSQLAEQQKIKTLQNIVATIIKF